MCIRKCLHTLFKSCVCVLQLAVLDNVRQDFRLKVSWGFFLRQRTNAWLGTQNCREALCQPLKTRQTGSRQTDKSHWVSQRDSER